MNSFSIKTEQKYEAGDVALFKLFSGCQHALYTEEELQTVDPEIRNLEFILSNESCPCCSGKEELVTVEEIHRHTEVAELEESLKSEHPCDDSDLRASRWDLDSAYIKQVKWAFDDQIKDPSHQIVYENHIHNARQRAESQLRSLEDKQIKVAAKGTATDQESIHSAKHETHLEWAKMQGEFFGRGWADMARPKPETPAVSPAHGDISITLTEKTYELELIVNSTRIERKLHYKVKYAGVQEISEWLPLAAIRDEQELLFEFHAKHPRKARPREDDWKVARATILW